jgi:hypothetical protein
MAEKIINIRIINQTKIKSIKNNGQIFFTTESSDPSQNSEESKNSEGGLKRIPCHNEA